MKYYSKIFIFLAVLLSTSVTFKVASSQESIYRSHMLFVGADHIFSLDDVVNYYILDPNMRQSVKVLLFSQEPTHQNQALIKIKQALMEVFIEEMYIEEGKRLYTELKGKIQGRKIFLLDQSKHPKSTSMEDIRIERNRVKKTVEQYYLSRVAQNHPFVSVEEASRRSSIIPKPPRQRALHEYFFVSPQEVRDYYNAHYESFAQSVSLYEVRFESPILVLGAFRRENLNEALSSRMRQVFFGVLDKEGVCEKPLSDEDKEVLLQCIADPTKQENPDDPIFRSIERHQQSFQEKGVVLEKLTSLSVLPYELAFRFIGADLYKLENTSSDQEYVYGSIRIQEKFNNIFPGLIKTRNLPTLSADFFASREDVFKNQIFPELHGKYAFESNAKEREVDWLMYSDSQALKLPVFFKFKVLWEHRGDERLTLASTSGYEMADDGLLEPILLSKKIEVMLQNEQLIDFFNNKRREFLNRYFEHAMPTKEAWVQKLFPHDTFKITYQEIESAFAK